MPSRWLLECAAEILGNFSKTYHYRFLLKTQNVETYDFICKRNHILTRGK